MKDMNEKLVHLLLLLTLSALILTMYVLAYVFSYTDTRNILHIACPLAFVVAIILGLLIVKLKRKKKYDTKMFRNRLSIYLCISVITFYIICKNMSFGYFGAIPVYLVGSLGLHMVYFLSASRDNHSEQDRGQVHEHDRGQVNL